MIFFYLLVSVMPLSRHPFWSGFVGDVTVVKLLGVICLVYAAFYLLSRRTWPRFFETGQARWFVFFAILAMASFVAAGSPQPFETSPFLSYASFLLFFFVTLSVVDSPDRVRWVLLVAIGSAAYASLHVIREWQKYGEMSLGYRPGWVTGDPNYFSESALICLPLAYYLLRTKQTRWERWFCLGSIVITLFALILAASRGAFLGLVLASMLVVWRSGQRLRNLAITGIVLLPLMLLTPSSPLDRLLNPNRGDQSSTDRRVALLEAGIAMLRARPLTGVGTGNFKPLVLQYAVDEGTTVNVAHNAYVEIAAENGLPGIVAFLAILFCALRGLDRVRRQTRTTPTSVVHQASQGLQVGLVAVAVTIVFISGQYQKLFWLAIFLSMCLPSFAPRGRAAEAGSAGIALAKNGQWEGAPAARGRPTEARLS